MAGESRQIDVWWLSPGNGPDAAGAALSLLDPEERSRFRRFATAAAAEFFAFRRAARRVILASYAVERPERLRFTEGSNRKPSLALPATKLEFSASDTGTTGVIAVASGMPVGVDVERTSREMPGRLAEGILSPAERQEWQRAAASERSRFLLRAWTAKEALVKGMGIGLDLATFRQIAVATETGRGAWRAATLGAGLASHGSWNVRELSLGFGAPKALVASIAAPVAVPVRIIDARSLLSRHGL